jgi:hypothetical protein
MTGNGVFVDEAHFIKRRCIETGPLAQVIMEANVIFASTPATGHSGIQGVLDGKVDGEEICAKVDFEFNCPACKKRQRHNPAVMCLHRLHMRPQIQNMHALMIARAAYGPESEAFRREIFGTAVYGSNTFIDPEHIKRLETAPRHKPHKPPRYIYVSCDPSGSTKYYVDDHTSEYAFVTAYMENGKAVVIFNRFRLRPP